MIPRVAGSYFYAAQAVGGVFMRMPRCSARVPRLRDASVSWPAKPWKRTLSWSVFARGPAGAT